MSNNKTMYKQHGVSDVKNSFYKIDHEKGFYNKGVRTTSEESREKLERRIKELKDLLSSKIN